MQSIFRLPWCSDQNLASKLSEKPALDSMRASPVTAFTGLSQFKRKRTSSPEPFSPSGWTQPHKKQRTEYESTDQVLPARPEQKQTLQQTTDSVAPQAVAHVSTPAKADHMDISTPNATVNVPELVQPAAESQDKRMLDAELSTMELLTGLSPLQQVIDNEFNMQILLKHNELRLIETELAKCQVALEQLRRCEIRPFPGSDQPSADVSSGLGASIEPPPGYNRPAYPAPYGVTDGPYTRHYRQWLLHDPEFDAVPLHAMQQYDSASFSGARSTRNHGVPRKSLNKSFSMPGRPDSLQALPNYPAPPPKDKSLALVLKRSTDGQMVKLICNNCHRGNFSSIQGFLNHCRIAHKVDYKSHDAAAIDCGQPLDQAEAANLPAETTQPAPSHKPSASRGSLSVSTPSMTNSKNLVHPMNMGGSVAMSPSVAQDVAFGDDKNLKSLPENSRSSSQSGTPLQASAHAPRLSAHFAKHKVGGNLEQAIASAKQTVDFGADEDMSSPDTSTPGSPSAPASGARTLGSKGDSSRKSEQRHRPSPLAATPATFAVLAQGHGEIPESPQDHLANLSPHTADSNPGLVSDHEDDDHNSGSEDEAPHATNLTSHSHPLCAVRRDCTDNMEIDIAVDDGIDEHGVVIRRNSMIAGDEQRTTLKTAGPSSKKSM